MRKSQLFVFLIMVNLLFLSSMQVNSTHTNSYDTNNNSAPNVLSTNYTANYLMLSQQEQQADYNMWGRHEGKFDIGTSLSISASQVEDPDYKNGRLVYLKPKVLAGNEIRFNSIIVSITSQNEGNTYTGNLLQHFRLYENNIDGWKLHPNSYTTIANYPFQASEVSKQPIELEFPLEQMNSDHIGFDQADHERYNYLAGDDRSEDYILKSGYFSPYKILNMDTADKALVTTFSLQTGLLNLEKEYVLQINSQVYGSSNFGDPNRKKVYDEFEYVYLRFPEFDQSNGAPSAELNNPSTPQVASNSLTYILFITSILIYFGSLLYIGRVPENIDTSNSDTNDLKNCPNHSYLKLRDGECLYCGTIEDKPLSWIKLTKIEKIIFSLIGLILIYLYLIFL